MGGECGWGWCLGGWCAFRWVVVAFVEALIVGFGECLGGVREEEGEGEREKKGAQGLLPRWAGAVNHALSLAKAGRSVSVRTSCERYPFFKSLTPV